MVYLGYVETGSLWVTKNSHLTKSMKLESIFPSDTMSNLKGAYRSAMLRTFMLPGTIAEK